ncbi:MAG TPA: DUF2007 domain-containing protein [Candidatus Acidoferrales bacterium]|nr:DUF2007 domain-containing protein [Candidatus Acidoferrales bacterium]
MTPTVLPAGYNAGMQHPGLVIVKTFGSRPEADIAKGALASAGIDAMIQADTAGGMREHLAWSGTGFRLLVREDDARAALEILTPANEAIVNDGEGKSPIL